MKRKLMSLGVMLVSLCFAGVALAVDAAPKKARSEVKKVQPVIKKKDAAREAKKAKSAENTATDSELEGATKRLGATAKKQHDMQKQAIDNLK